MSIFKKKVKCPYCGNLVKKCANYLAIHHQVLKCQLLDGHSGQHKSFVEGSNYIEDKKICDNGGFIYWD